MKYLYRIGEPAYYATNLTWDSSRGSLEWRSGRGQDVLIVQTAFGVNPIAEMDAICKEMEGIDLRFSAFYPLRPKLSVRFVNAKQGATGCPGNGEACTYTIFPCVANEETDECVIYAPAQEQRVSSPVCHVPLRVALEVSQDMWIQKFLWHTREIPSGFYCIRFITPCGENYQDGFLEYKIGDYLIPITRKMFESHAIYIHTDIKPVVIPRTNAVTLIEPPRKPPATRSKRGF
ncbi:MAG: hypothetical protein IJQ81_18070 [Oscillibacter sp.]|nr:hypothetical protein [Oscillibacter sp.]